MGNPETGTPKNLVLTPTLWYNDNMKLSKQYIAGLIDGEGYMGLIPRYDCKDNYNPTIKIALTERDGEVLKTIQNQYLGNISIRKGNQEHNRKISWCLQIMSRKRCRKILEDILPYLVIKKKRAELMMEYINLGHMNPRYGKYKQSDRDRGVEIYLEIRKCNSTGLATTE